MEYKPLYTIPEVAEILHTNENLVGKLRRAGMLRCLKLGQYKVRAEELDRFLREAEGFDITDPEDVVPLDSGVSPKRMRHPQRSAADKRGCALIRPDKSIAKESL